MISRQNNPFAWFIRSSVRAAASLALIATIGCDTGDPTAEELPIVRVEFKLIPSEGEIQRVNVSDSESDSLYIDPSEEYIGQIDVFDADGTNVTSRIRENAERFQAFYSTPSGSGLTITITDTESSYGGNDFGADLPVGLSFSVDVDEEIERGLTSLTLRLLEFGDRTKSGSATSGEQVAEFVVPIYLDVPIPRIPNEPITRTLLTLTRTDMTERWIVEAANTFGLNLGQSTTPPNLSITQCLPSEPSGPPTDCDSPNVLDLTRITLLPGEYTGSWQLFEMDSGADLTTTIFETGRRHLFTYQNNLPADNLTITDADSSGQPIGLSFAYSVPTNTLVRGSFRVMLTHFDPAHNETKANGLSTSPRDLSYAIPMSIAQNGLPEYPPRMEVTFSRSDSDQYSRIVVVGEDQIFDEQLSSLTYESCSRVAEQDVCVVTDSLELVGNANYTGSVTLLDSDGGDSIMNEIVEEGQYHQFSFEGLLAGGINIVDLDVNGSPVGFSFDVTTPQAMSAGSLRITLTHYGRFAFKESQSDENELDLSVAVDVSVR